LLVHVFEDAFPGILADTRDDHQGQGPSSSDVREVPGSVVPSVESVSALAPLVLKCTTTLLARDAARERETKASMKGSKKRPIEAALTATPLEYVF
jgi:hypothetical protein